MAYRVLSQIQICILFSGFISVEFSQAFCPTNISERNRRSAFFSCGVKGDKFRYHCMLDTGYETLEFCQISATVHAKDGCPIFLNSKSFDFRPCNRNGCPQTGDEDYLLAELWKYPACLTPFITTRKRRSILANTTSTTRLHDPVRSTLLTGKTSTLISSGEDLKYEISRQSLQKYVAIGGVLFGIMFMVFVVYVMALVKDVKKNSEFIRYEMKDETNFKSALPEPESSIYEEMEEAEHQL